MSSTLAARILKHLAATEIIREVDVDCYEPTGMTRMLTTPKYRDAIPFWCISCSPLKAVPG